MKFIDLSKKIINNLNNAQAISHSIYPDKISFGDEINKKIRKIDEYSKKPSIINRSEGTVNYEYGFSTFNFLDEVYASQIISGS